VADAIVYPFLLMLLLMIIIPFWGCDYSQDQEHEQEGIAPSPSLR
jgi:hypothetical protein